MRFMRFIHTMWTIRVYTSRSAGRSRVRDPSGVVNEGLDVVRWRRAFGTRHRLPYDTPPACDAGLHLAPSANVRGDVTPFASGLECGDRSHRFYFAPMTARVQ